MTATYVIVMSFYRIPSVNFARHCTSNFNPVTLKYLGGSVRSSSSVKGDITCQNFIYSRLFQKNNKQRFDI